MQIEPATAEDCDRVAEVHVAAWRAAYVGLLPSDFLRSLSVEGRAAAWRRVFQEGKSELLVARAGPDIVGFVSFGASRDEDAPPCRGEIWSVYLHPRVWSTGTGRALWRAADERLLKMGFRSTSLWVIIGNERAMRFYTKLGFEVDPGSEKDLQIAESTVREIRLVRTTR